MKARVRGKVSMCRAQPEAFRARKRWRKPSFTTLRRLHRLALRLWVRIPNPVIVAINSASAWPTREKRRVTKEACNRIKRRAVTAKAAPARKVVSCSSFAAVGRFWASPRLSLPEAQKPSAGERSGSLLLGDEKLVVRDGNGCRMGI